MKTSVFHRLISCVLAAVLVLLPLGTPISWNVPLALAATLVEHHYLKIEHEDTISEALDRHFPCRSWRLWGKNGAVARVAALNAQIQNINRLRPGMLIDIGEYAKTPQCEERVPASLEQPNLVPNQEQGQEQEQVGEEDAESLIEDPADPGQLPSDRYGFLEAIPEFSFSKISSTDKSTGGSAIYSSNLMPGIRFAWGQHWSSHVQTSLNLGIRSESYIAPVGYSLENPSRTMTDLAVGVRWAPFDKFPDLAFDSSLDFRQELFARSISLTSVSLDSAMIPELSVGIRYRVLDLTPFTLTLHAQGMILFPQSTSGYSIQAGTGAAYGIVFAEDISKKVRLSGSLQYSNRSQDSAIATQSRTDVGLTFGITFRFDAILERKKVNSGDLP